MVIWASDGDVVDLGLDPVDYLVFHPGHRVHRDPAVLGKSPMLAP
jgi:hypothetical protein